jgi:signal transduction histidine kinase
VTPGRLDALLVAGVAGAVTAQLAYERAGFGIWLVAVATVAPLALRRRLPLASCLGVLAGDAVAWALGWHLAGDAPVGLAVYSAARYAGRAGSFAALAAAQAWVVAVLLTGHVDTWSDVLGAAPLLAGVWALGAMVRRNRHQTALLRALADRLRREQSANAHRAVAEERARIARELHDTVSHHIAAIAVQAEAARLSLTGHPERADAGLRHVAESAGAALTDMRLLLTVLRPEGAGERPAPTMADLDDLFAAARRAGLRVETTVDALLPQPSGAVQTCVYRLVQESLTNVIKHAGPVRVWVRLSRGGDEITVTVENEPGTPKGLIPGTGAGLAGLRTRVETFGGRLRAGPEPDGRFRVHATIPASAEVGVR